MRESLPFDEIEYEENISLEDILNTLDDSDTGFLTSLIPNILTIIHEKNKDFSILT